MSNVRPHMNTNRFVSIERSAKRFPPKASRVLLFVAGHDHRSDHNKANPGLHSQPTVANRKLAFVQRWRLRRQRKQMLVTQLALPLCAAAVFHHGWGCHCYAWAMRTTATIPRLEGRPALSRVRPNPSIVGAGANVPRISRSERACCSLFVFF